MEVTAHVNGIATVVALGSALQSPQPRRGRHVFSAAYKADILVQHDSLQVQVAWD
jgi:hypothetical protein